jgi:hypothetical protein
MELTLPSVKGYPRFLMPSCLEARYRSLSPAEQTCLRERATNNLLQAGMSRRLLLETLVMGEICRLLQEQEKPQEPE